MARIYGRARASSSEYVSPLSSCWRSASRREGMMEWRRACDLEAPKPLSVS